MKVLITGGYGFIGSYVAEKFFKEDYEIIIIDDLSSGQKSNVSIPHTAYTFAADNDNCTEVFRIHNIDIVVHLAHTDTSSFFIHDNKQSNIANISGLINILSLSAQYKVKKFLLISDIKVYGDKQELITENTTPTPNSQVGLNKLAEEMYCLHWQKLYGLSSIILRLSTVYGPRQGKNSISELLTKVLADNLTNSRSNIDELSSADYIYITDVTEAIYRAAIAIMPEKIINVTQGQEIKPQTIVNLLKNFSQPNSISNNFIEYVSASVNNSLCCSRLAWSPRHTFAEGLRFTYDWYRQLPAQTNLPENSKVWTKFKQQVFPYIENLILFSIVATITLFSTDRSPINRDIGLDYSFVYITIMGLLYGKSQSILATILAIALLFYSRILNGADFVSLIYQTKPMFHMAIYLLIGVLTGYITDNHQMRLQNMKITLDNFSTRYKFLEKLYLEIIEIKNKLYNQLINSSDSIGRLYSIVQKLDSVEAEYIYTAATEVTMEIMDVQQVAIYTLGKNKYYLRQKIKSPQASANLLKSLKIDSSPYLQAIMQEHKIFVNKNLEPDLPDMAAPVVCNNQVIAVIQIYNLPFEKLDLHHETLFKITSKLIADALGKAYLFERSIQDKKYISNTRILLPAEFTKILKEVEKRALSKEQFTIFKVIQDETTNLQSISDILDRIIREEDFIGLNCNDDVNILLMDIAEEFVGKVQTRIESAGIKIALLEVA